MILFRLIVAFCFVLPASLLAKGIHPEDIGATQYGVSHVYAAQRYEDIVSDKKFYPTLKKLLLTPFDQLDGTLHKMFSTSKSKQEFIEKMVKIQVAAQGEQPRLILIGKHQAFATDGHHRVHGQTRISELLKRSGELWPEETRKVLKKADRIGKDGKFIVSLPMDDFEELARLPKDATSRDVVRELLKNEAGLWKDKTLQSLAEKHYGEEVKKISNADLDRLAKAMGISDGPDGLRFIGIMELKDTPERLLLGKFFDTRNIKDDVIYKDYAEFFVADDVKDYVIKNPGKFPTLDKFLKTGSVSYGFQEEFLEKALLEIDQVLVEDPLVTKRLLSLARKHPKRVERNIVLAQKKFCEGVGKNSSTCKSWLNVLQTDPASVYNRCSGKDSKACDCVKKALHSLLSR